MGMICKYEGEQSLSAVASELGLPSTVNTKSDAAHIKEHVDFIFNLTHICPSISTIFNMSFF
jgi:hypothetical protein